MIALFLDNNYNLKYPIKIWSKWDYIKRVLRRELIRVTKYYHARSKHVNNSNIFSNLIKLTTPSLDLDIMDYYIYVDANSEYTSRRFDFVSNKNKGKVLKDIFYKNERVIINYVDTEFNIFNIENIWKGLSPIRVIYTNEYKLDYYQFDLTKENEHETITIVEVNVNMLLLMYKCWCKHRLEIGDSINSNYFIAQIVLPNMVKTYIDFIIFNRFMNLFYNIPMENNTLYMKLHPFAITDLTASIDKILIDIIDTVKYTSIPIVQLLKTIPTVYNKDMLDTLHINNPIYTRQSEWTIWVARLKIINFILDILGDKGIKRNGDIINKLPVYIRMLENRSTDIRTQLPYHMWTEINKHINNIKLIAGRR